MFYLTDYFTWFPYISFDLLLYVISLCFIWLITLFDFLLFYLTDYFIWFPYVKFDWLCHNLGGRGAWGTFHLFWIFADILGHLISADTMSYHLTRYLLVSSELIWSDHVLEVSCQEHSASSTYKHKTFRVNYDIKIEYILQLQLPVFDLAAPALAARSNTEINLLSQIYL